MAKAKYGQIVDGQIYESGEELPDFGSIVTTAVLKEDESIRCYEGLSKDIGKLPHYVATGSSFFAIDTGDFYKYEETTDEWKKV